MEEVSYIEVYKKAGLYDPTQTTALRKAWARDNNTRYRQTAD